jgi:hypothetical protein
LKTAASKCKYAEAVLWPIVESMFERKQDGIFENNEMLAFFLFFCR